MKATAPNPPLPVSNAGYDFCGRPPGLNLDHTATVAGYGKVTIRPIRLDDETEMIRFHRDLSEESIYMRYFQYLGLDRRTGHERLVRICTNTPESYALVMELQAIRHRPASILGVGRLTVDAELQAANFDTLITNEEKVPRMGKLLLNSLIKLARAHGFKVLKGDLLAIDHETLNLCRSLGFSLQTELLDGMVRVRMNL